MRDEPSPVITVERGIHSWELLAQAAHPWSGSAVSPRSTLPEDARFSAYASLPSIPVGEGSSEPKGACETTDPPGNECVEPHLYLAVKLEEPSAKKYGHGTPWLPDSPRIDIFIMSYFSTVSLLPQPRSNRLGKHPSGARFIRPSRLNPHLRRRLTLPRQGLVACFCDSATQRDTTSFWI
jgi:hypothetical protein